VKLGTKLPSKKLNEGLTMAAASNLNILPAGESVSIDFSLNYSRPHFYKIDLLFQDSSFEEGLFYMPAGEELNSSADSSQGLRIKIVPDVGSRAGIDGQDFDTKLDESIKIWFDGFKDNFKLCE
jgi:hypothetical protein